MIVQLAAVFGISLLTFILLAFLTISEERGGRRLFLSGARGWLDAKAAGLERATAHFFDYVARRVIKFTWYYSLHSFFRGLRALLFRLYHYVEHRMRLHHHRARAARSVNGNSRLSEIAEHKQLTALSEKEKQKRREDSLG